MTIFLSLGRLGADSRFRSLSSLYCSVVEIDQVAGKHGEKG